MSKNRKEIGSYDYIEYFKRNTGLMVSMDKNGKPNVMALDWKKIQEFEGNTVIRTQVDYTRYTYKLLTEGVNEFTVNIPSEKYIIPYILPENTQGEILINLKRLV